MLGGDAVFEYKGNTEAFRQMNGGTGKTRSTKDENFNANYQCISPYVRRLSLRLFFKEAKRKDSRESLS